MQTIYEKPTANIIFYSETQSSLPKIRKKTRMPTGTIAIQHCAGSSSQSNQTRKNNNKRHLNWRRSKTIFICIKYDLICRKFQRIYKKATKANKFSKVAGYKISKQNAVAQLSFYIPIMNNPKNKLRKEFHLQQQLKE